MWGKGACGVRSGNAPQMLAALRNASISLLHAPKSEESHRHRQKRILAVQQNSTTPRYPRVSVNIEEPGARPLLRALGGLAQAADAYSTLVRARAGP